MLQNRSRPAQAEAGRVTPAREKPLDKHSIIGYIAK